MNAYFYLLIVILFFMVKAMDYDDENDNNLRRLSNSNGFKPSYDKTKLESNSSRLLSSRISSPSKMNFSPNFYDLSKKMQSILIKNSNYLNRIIDNEIIDIHPIHFVTNSGFYFHFVVDHKLKIKKMVKDAYVREKENALLNMSILDERVKKLVIEICLDLGWRIYDDALIKINKKFNDHLFDKDDVMHIFQYYYAIKLINIAQRKIKDSNNQDFIHDFKDFPGMKINDFSFLEKLEDFLRKFAITPNPVILRCIYFELQFYEGKVDDIDIVDEEGSDKDSEEMQMKYSEFTYCTIL